MPYELTARDAARFRSKVRETTPDGCWEWLGGHFTMTGYTIFNMKMDDGVWRPTVAHRVAYELLVGPIPDGLQIDHLCRNRGCVNPAHLEPVTARINTLRGESVSAKEARQTHCQYGHPFDAVNTYRKPNGKRECRICMSAREAKRAIEPKVRDIAAWYAEGHHCRQGHLYDEANTYWKQRGSPACRTCARERRRQQRQSR